MNKIIKNYFEFINELIEYETEDTPLVKSIRSEEYLAKDDLRITASVIDEILKLISSGEELEKEQLELVKDIYNKVQLLKRSIQRSEEIKNRGLNNDKEE